MALILVQDFCQGDNPEQEPTKIEADTEGPDRFNPQQNTDNSNINFFFYLGFLSRTFTIHGTAGEGGGYLFNSSLPHPPASQTHRH